MNRRNFISKTIPAAMLVGICGTLKLESSECYLPHKDSVLLLGKWSKGPGSKLYLEASKAAHERGWRYSVELQFDQEFEGEDGFYSLFWKLVKPGVAYGNRFLFNDFGVVEDTLFTCQYAALETLEKLYNNKSL